MSTIAFAPLTEAQKIFKAIVWTPMIMAGESWIEGMVPFLALPVVKNLEEGAINEITDVLFNNLVLVMDVTAITLVNSAMQSAYDSASLKLKVVAHDKGPDSPEYQAALADAATALSRFARFGVQQ